MELVNEIDDLNDKNIEINNPSIHKYKFKATRTQ